MPTNVIISNNKFNMFYDLSAINADIYFDVRNVATKSITRISLSVINAFADNDLLIERKDFSIDCLNLLTTFKISKVIINNFNFLKIDGEIESLNNSEYYISNINSVGLIDIKVFDKINEIKYFDGVGLNLEFNSKYLNGLITFQNLSLHINGNKFLDSKYINKLRKLIPNELALTLKFADGKKLMFRDGAIFDDNSQIHGLNNVVNKSETLNKKLHIKEVGDINVTTSALDNNSEKIILGINISKLFTNFTRKIIYGVGLSGNGLLNFGYYDGNSDVAIDSDLIVGNGTKDKPNILFYIKNKILSGLGGIDIKTEGLKYLMSNNIMVSVDEMRKVNINQIQQIVDSDNLEIQLEHGNYIPTVDFYVKDVVTSDMEKLNLRYKINIKEKKINILHYPDIANNVLIMVINR